MEKYWFDSKCSVVNLLLGFGLASALPKDIRKTSKYAQLVEGKGHHEEAAHH